MPPLIGGVIVAIAYLAAGAAGYIAMTTAVVMAIMSVAAAAASYALQSKAKAPGFSSLSGMRMITSRDSIRARDLVYGTMRKGGVVVFIGARENKTWLDLVIVLAGHEVEAIDQIYFNEDLAFLADGTKQGRFADTIYGPVTAVEKHLGTADQTASPYLMANYPGIWTDSHRLRGCAYIVVALAYSPNVYHSVPNITAIVRGKKVYDPRTATTVFSANPGLCLADYLNDSVYGLGALYGTDIASAELIAAANLCDEWLEITGGYEQRYAANGILTSAEDPQSNIEMLLSAMAGRLTYVGGQWIVRGAAYEAPTITLDEGDLRGSLAVQTRQQRRDLCNAVRGVFVSPLRSWQITDFPPLTSVLFQADDNGERIWRDVELPFTTSETMAQRLAKIELYSTREQIAVSCPCSLKALQLRAGDTVALTNTRMGWSAKPFLVTDWAFSADTSAQGGPLLGCSLQLRETSAAVYDVTASEQQLLDAEPDSLLPDAFSVAVPIFVGITADNTVATDGTVLHRLRIEWAPHADGFVRVGGWIEIQYKRQADSEWTTAASVAGSDTVTVIGPLEDNVTYDVRLRAVNELGVQSAWTGSSGGATADSTAPGIPTGIIGTATTLGAILQWTNPADFDLACVEIWVSLTNNSATATRWYDVTGEAYLVGKLTAGVPYYFWLSARDTSGNHSALTPGPSAGVAVTPLGVATPDVDANAITSYVQTVQAAEITWSNVQSVWNSNSLIGHNHTVVAAGAVLIVGMIHLEVESDGGGAAFVDWKLSIYRDYTLLHERIGTFNPPSGDWEWANITWSYIDTPGNGTHTYQIFAEMLSTDWPSTGKAQRRYLQTIELKK